MVDRFVGLDPTRALSLAGQLRAADATLQDAGARISGAGSAIAATGGDADDLTLAVGTLRRGRRWLGDAAQDIDRRVSAMDRADVLAREQIRSALHGAHLSSARRAALAAILANPNRHVLDLDLAGDGEIVEVVGDLDDAAHVAVLVPGMGSTLDNEIGVLAQARRLAAAANAADPKHPTAVIVWLGYDAPPALDGIDTVWTTLTGHGSVLDRRDADAGAIALRGFLTDLRQFTRATAPPTITLIGHSYGSLVVGTALTRNLPVDNVVVVGSPGVGADSVGALDMPPGTRFYAAREPFDPVADTAWFGAEPTDAGFGATVFDTGGGRGSLAGFADHGAYFDTGSESLQNLARITVGTNPTTPSVSPAATAATARGFTTVLLGSVAPILPLFNDVRDAQDEAIKELEESIDLGPLDAPVDRALDTGEWIENRATHAVDNLTNEAGEVAESLTDWLD